MDAPSPKTAAAGFAWRRGLAALALAVVAGCGGDDSDSGAASGSRRETVGGYTVVWLQGSPYEMGYQHASLLRDALPGMAAYLSQPAVQLLVEAYARYSGLRDLAYARSYPDVIEECRGFVDGAADPAVTLDHVLLLNFGDVLVESLEDLVPGITALMPSCAGMVAAGPAAADGGIYHGRLLDWGRNEFVQSHPVVFVRSPSDGLAHVVIGFPGNISPYQGMNEAGVSAASNEAQPGGRVFPAGPGRSHVQLLGQILKRAHSLAEAEAMVRAEANFSTESLHLADGVAREGAVFELAPGAVGVKRTGPGGLVYETNHFTAPGTADADRAPEADTSRWRYDRLAELLEPGGAESWYGRIDPQALITVMRDRVNPETREVSPPETFDDGGRSLSTHGCLYAIVFDPAHRWFWMAAGRVPVPRMPFQGFSLLRLLGRGDAPEVTPRGFS